MNANPSKHFGDKLPVDNVLWIEAIQFCNKLSVLENLDSCYSIIGSEVKCDFTKNGYRLPTEAEWEYAAKGGSLSNNYIYAGSNNISEVAWFRENSNHQSHIIGSKNSNELGLFDMSGNVWEWCWDRYDGDYYSYSPEVDPRGPSSGLGRVIRGGSWYNRESGLRSSGRLYVETLNYRDNLIGFRILRKNWLQSISL